MKTRCFEDNDTSPCNVVAEGIVAPLNKDCFNYTEWRRTALREIDVVELSRRAAVFNQQNQRARNACHDPNKKDHRGHRQGRLGIE